MQIHAWCEMTGERLASGATVIEAVFGAVNDPEPCEHCQALTDVKGVAEETEEERLLKETSKLLGVLNVPGQLAVPQPKGRLPYSLAAVNAEPRQEAPSAPPPRGFKA